MTNEELKQRLSELVMAARAPLTSNPIAEKIADHLIANGVTIRERWEWIPVTERLPEIVETKNAYRNTYKKSGRVLCACLQADGKQLVKEGYMYFFNDNPKPNWSIPGTIHSVTHWMPLPAPPEAEKGGEPDA